MEQATYEPTKQASSAFPDLIAVKQCKAPIAVECKYRKQYLGPEEKQAMIELWADYGLDPFLAYKSSKDNLLIITSLLQLTNDTTNK